LLAAAALVAGVAGCGDGDEGQSADESAGQQAPAATEFPSPGGSSLEQIYTEATPDQNLVVAPAGKAYTPGKNRIGFGVFTAGGEQITDAEVAIYAAPGPNGEVQGPYPARIDSLETDPAFEARTTADDPDSARVVYVANIEFDRKGEWRMIALIREGEELRSSIIPSVVVRDYAAIPDVGERAPVVDTPTTEDVGDVGEIDTRDPHDTMHDVNLAQVLGERPVVLLFATPALCQSRVCGPVVDVAEQVKSELGDEAAFIHMEVFKENNPNEGVRPQLRTYGLPTEPWLFVIDESGKVSTRIEGAFSVEELKSAVRKVT
jgi:hypothetical protein